MTHGRSPESSLGWSRVGAGLSSSRLLALQSHPATSEPQRALGEGDECRDLAYEHSRKGPRDQAPQCPPTSPPCPHARYPGQSGLSQQSTEWHSCPPRNVNSLGLRAFDMGQGGAKSGQWPTPAPPTASSPLQGTWCPLQVSALWSRVGSAAQVARLPTEQLRPLHGGPVEGPPRCKASHGHPAGSGPCPVAHPRPHPDREAVGFTLGGGGVGRACCPFPPRAVRVA